MGNGNSGRRKIYDRSLKVNFTSTMLNGLEKVAAEDEVYMNEVVRRAVRQYLRLRLDH